ncbi:ABC transporter permease [Candidatus Saccharibacteria bacterium]|nr:ABC transporter permease [Candidatus Saccharibacteria bacterium]
MKKKIHDKATVDKAILLSIAYSNLTHKKLRTFLTLFGIAIGIGSIYFLLSFGLGLQHLVTDEVIGSQSIKTIDVSTPNSKIIKLDDVTVQRITEITEIDEVGRAYYYPGSFKISSSESDAIVYGVDSGYEKLTYLNVIEGTLPSESDVENPLVMNLASLQSIGLGDKPSEILGKQVKITVPLTRVNEKLGTFESDFTVVGVMDSGSGSELFLPSSTFRSLGLEELTLLKTGLNDVENVKKVRSQIESFGLETSSPVDTLNEINSIFRYLNFILIGFGGIGMIIAVLGMFNTLTISLLERTKEIGLMVALGARSVDMRLLFFFEALLLSAIGAVTGIFSAVLLGRIVNIFMNVFAHGRGVKNSFELFSNPWWLLLGTVIFMICIGLIVVYIPARRAEKINPIDALRRE